MTKTKTVDALQALTNELGYGGCLATVGAELDNAWSACSEANSYCADSSTQISQLAGELPGHLMDGLVDALSAAEGAADEAQGQAEEAERAVEEQKENVENYTQIFGGVLSWLRDRLKGDDARIAEFEAVEDLIGLVTGERCKRNEPK